MNRSQADCQEIPPFLIALFALLSPAYAFADQKEATVSVVLFEPSPSFTYGGLGGMAVERPPAVALYSINGQTGVEVQCPPGIDEVSAFLADEIRSSQKKNPDAEILVNNRGASYASLQVLAARSEVIRTHDYAELIYINISISPSTWIPRTAQNIGTTAFDLVVVTDGRYSATKMKPASIADYEYDFEIKFRAELENFTSEVLSTVRTYFSSYRRKLTTSTSMGTNLTTAKAFDQNPCGY